MPEEPGKYQTGFLLLSHAWDWKVLPGKYHLLWCNVWLSPPSLHIFLSEISAVFLTEVSAVQIPYAPRFGSAAPFPPISLLLSRRRLPDHLPSHLWSEVLSVWNGQIRSPDQKALNPCPWNPAVPCPPVSALVHCIWYNRRRNILPDRL